MAVEKSVLLQQIGPSEQEMGSVSSGFDDDLMGGVGVRSADQTRGVVGGKGGKRREDGGSPSSRGMKQDVRAEARWTMS